MKTLEDLKASNALRASHVANLRMQLWVTGETHRVFAEVGDKATKAVLSAAGSDGKLDGLGLHRAVTGLDTAWNRGFAEWKRTFTKLREMSVALPFGALALLHREYLGAGDGSQGTGKDERRTTKRARGKSLREQESVLDAVFNPQLQEILDAASRRVFGDGLQLSQRLWRLDRESQQALRQVLYNGVAQGLSAWDIGKELEQFLGAGADCPRWTRTRLNRLTKADIAAGDPTGLIRGGDCNGQGIAYNALRLARNEIQIAHATATDAIVNRVPWIEQERVNLSPAHAERDICDDVAGGGERGDGVYPKGEIFLPLHVQCLCFKTAELMKPDEFVSKMRGWLDGTQPWTAMDRYAEMVGGNVDVDLMGTRAATQLALWLWGTAEQMERWVN